MKILITGASGFIGSFIVEEALKRGFETWAAVRKSSSRDFLQDEHIRFIELNLSSEKQLKEQLKDLQFDYVVHAAGVTKCLHKEDFFRINTEGTKNLVRALIDLKMPLKRFVYISSLSIMGAIREEQPYREIREDDKQANWLQKSISQRSTINAQPFPTSSFALLESMVLASATTL